MNIATARDNEDKPVRHIPSGRRGKLTGFSGLVRVFVRYDDGVTDQWGTLPEELEFV